METAPVVQIPKPNKTWKIVGIITIASTIIFAAATGFFVWKYIEQQKEIDNLRTELGQMDVIDNGGTTSNFEKGKVIVSAQELIKILKKELDVDSDSNISLGIDNFKNSQFEPFQVIGSSVQETDGEGNFLSGWYAYFYRKGKNGTWKYGISGNGMPGCKEFKGDVRYALSELECMEANVDNATTVGAFFNL